MRSTLSITPQKKPSNVTAYIQVSGSSLSQVYDNFNGSYLPNRAAEGGETLLVAHVTINDPNTSETYEATKTSVRWYEVTKDGVKSEITTSNQTAKGCVLSGNDLKVVKNVSVGESGISFMAEISYTDPNSYGSGDSVINKDVMLTTNLSSVESLTLQRISGEGYVGGLHVINPLNSPFENDNSWKRKVGCQLYDGNVALNDAHNGTDTMGNAFYFWYYKFKGDSEWIIMREPENWFACEYYEDGTMAKEATVDLSLVGFVNLRCRAGFIPYGEIPDYKDEDGIIQPYKLEKYSYLVQDYELSVRLPQVIDVRACNVSSPVIYSNELDSDRDVYARCLITVPSGTVNDMTIGTYAEWEANTAAQTRMNRMFRITWYKTEDDGSDTIIGTGEFLKSTTKALGYTSVNNADNSKIWVNVEYMTMCGGEIAGMARLYNDSNPSAKVVYGLDRAKEIARHLRLAVVKGGKPNKIAARGRLTLSTEGEEIKIDGTDGDVMVYMDTPNYLIKGKTLVGSSTQQICGVSLSPTEWNGIKAKRFEPWAVSAWESLHAKLTGDVVSQAHCVYNTDVAGSYSTPSALFTDAIMPNGKGYGNVGISGISDINYAQYKNKKSANSGEAVTNKPYMGLYYEFYEFILSLMYAHTGTLNITDKSIIGPGCTPQEPTTASTFNDTAISADSGAKIIQSNGTENYLSVYGSLKIGSGGSDIHLTQGINGSMYNFIESGEDIRLLDGITKAGLTSKVGSSSNVFTYDTNGNVIALSSSTVNLSTGAGMVAGQRYYVVRNIPSMEGIADGMFTAVTNIYVKTTARSGIYYGTTDISGATVIFKFSIACVFGFCLPLRGNFRHITGLYHTTYNVGGTYKINGYAADKPEDVKPLTDTTIYGDTGMAFDVLTGLRKWASGIAASGGWIKSADYNTSIMAYTATGGGSHTYENAYLWRSGTCYGQGVSDHPEDGKECVVASVAGCNVSYANASVRTLNCYSALSYGLSSYAGAFAAYPCRG